MTTSAEMPPCHCAERGQPVSEEVGVLHLADCEWYVWFLSTAGCMGDD